MINSGSVFWRLISRLNSSKISWLPSLPCISGTASSCKLLLVPFEQRRLTIAFSIGSGLALFLYSPHRPIRWLALGYPVLILLIIMVSFQLSAFEKEYCSPGMPDKATANHFLLDAVGGFFVTVVAYKINHLLLYLRPLEEWGMWLCR